MGDTGDDFNAMKEASQVKRAANRGTSAEILKAKGIEFESKNIGAHLIVKGDIGIIDFWPGTGKWIRRKSLIHGRGVFSLIKLITGDNR